MKQKYLDDEGICLMLGLFFLALVVYAIRLIKMVL